MTELEIVHAGRFRFKENIEIRTECRKCIERVDCDIRQAVEFPQPIDPAHSNPHYTFYNIFMASIGECPFYRTNDDEGEE